MVIRKIPKKNDYWLCVDYVLAKIQFISYKSHKKDQIF